MPEENATAARTALVTGASSGIGRAIAARLRGEGYAVLAVARNADALQSLADDCGAEPLPADLRQTATLVERLAGRRIDLLVQSAGVLSTRAAFQDIDPSAIDTMIGINLVAPLHLARALLPSMIARGSGHLVFIGSIAGRWPHPNAAVYGASKAGLSLFCDALRCDLLGTGVRVTEVAPGRVETELYRTALSTDDRAALYAGYEPMHPADIAAVVSHAAALPAHVDVSRIEVFPTNQALAGARIVKAR